MNKFSLVLFLSLVLNISFANCTSPTATSGALEYFSTDKTHKFCNGTDWISIKKGGIKEEKVHDFSGEIYVGDFNYLTIDGDHLYVVGNNLTVLNISNPKNISTIAQYPISGNILKKAGNYLHIFDQTTKNYSIYDAADPSSISIVSSLNLPTASNISSLILDETNKFSYFVSPTYSRFYVLDYSDPSSMVLSHSITDLTDLGGVNKILKNGTLIYTLNISAKSISVIDVSFPNTSSIINTYSLVSYTGTISDFSFMNNYLYLTYDTYNPNPALLIFDATDPMNITFKKGYTNFNQLSSVEAFGGTLNFISRQGTHYFVRFDPNDSSLLYTSHSEYIYNYTGFDRLDVNSNWVVSGFRALGRIAIYDNRSKLTLSNNSIGSAYDSSMQNESGASIQFMQKVGNKVAMSYTNTSLFVMDVTNPANMIKIGSYKNSYAKINNTYSDGFAFDGVNAYRSYANSPNYIEIIDVVTDPSNPKVTLFLNANFSSIRGLIVEGNYLYVASSGNDTLVIFDISNPHDPVFVSKLTDSTNIDYISDIRKSGNYIYAWGLFSGTKYLTSIDVSDPANPVVLDSIVNPSYSSVEGFSCNSSLCILNTYGTDDTYVIDVSDSSNLSQIALFDSGVGNANLQLIGNTLYAANGGIRTYDLSTPSAPSLIHATGSIPGATKIEVDGAKIFMGGGFLRSFDIISPTSFVELQNSYYTGKMPDPLAVDVIGDRAFVLNGSGSITTLDISDKSNPLIINQYENAILASSKDLKISGNNAFILSGSSLHIFNLSNPISPSLISSLTLATELGGAHRIFLEGSYAYIVAKTNSRFSIVDISNINSPTLVSSTSDASMISPENISINNNKAYIVSTSSKSLVTFDISNKSAPSLFSSIIDTTKLTSPLKVEVVGNYAYVVAANVSGGGIFDISTSSISFVSNLYTTFSSDLIAFGDYLYLKSQNANYQILKVSDPTRPVVISGNRYSAGASSSFTNAVLRGDYIYSITSSMFDIVYANVAHFSYLNEVVINTSHPTSSISDSVRLGNYIFTINARGMIYAIKDDGVDFEFASQITPSRYKSASSYKMAIETGYLYVYESLSYSVTVFDISDPYNISELGSYLNYSNIGPYIDSVNLYGSLAVLTGGYKVSIVDFTNKSAPVFVGKYENASTLSSSYSYSRIKDNYLFVCSVVNNAIRVFDISVPSSISLVASLIDSTNLDECRSFDRDGDFLYQSSNPGGKLSVIDISDPVNPVITKVLTDSIFTSIAPKMRVINDTLYFYASELNIFDLTDKLNPLKIDTISFANYQNISYLNNNLYVNSINDTKYTKYSYEKIIPLSSCSGAGSLEFNSTKNIMAYCDGSNLLPLSLVDGAGGSGCSSPSAAIGSLKYITPENIYRFCDGANWVDL